MRSRILPVAVGKPRVVMFVPGVFRHEPAEERVHVIPQGVLHFGEKNTGRRMERGHHAHAVPHTRLGEKPLHLISQIKELHFLTRVKLYRLRFDQHDRSPSPSYSLLVSASAVPARGRGTAPAPSGGNSCGTRSNAGRNGGGILCR